MYYSISYSIILIMVVICKGIDSVLDTRDSVQWSETDSFYLREVYQLPFKKVLSTCYCVVEDVFIKVMTNLLITNSNLSTKVTNLRNISGSNKTKKICYFLDDKVCMYLFFFLPALAIPRHWTLALLDKA